LIGLVNIVGLTVNGLDFSLVEGEGGARLLGTVLVDIVLVTKIGVTAGVLIISSKLKNIKTCRKYNSYSHLNVIYS
jgi:hypothetical protein